MWASKKSVPIPIRAIEPGSDRTRVCKPYRHHGFRLKHKAMGAIYAHSRLYFT